MHKYILDEFQADAYRQLRGDLSRQQMAAMTAPPGFGKTLLLRYLVGMMWLADEIDEVIVAVPTNVIKAGWYEPCEIKNGSCVSSVSWGQTSRTDLPYAMRLTPKFGHVISHAAFRQYMGVIKRYVCEAPEDCSRMLLILDEAHHNRGGKGDKDANALYEAVERWKQRKGKVVTVTASPVEEMNLPDYVIPITRSYAAHSKAGFAPRNIEVHTELVDGSANTLDQLLGKDMMTIDAKTLAATVVDIYELDGHPKAMIFIPCNDAQASAREYADAFVTALTAKGYRVLDAVGEGQDVASRVHKAMITEKKRINAGLLSEIDVILSAKRFEEGADWPPCSHVYRFGLTYALWLIRQQIGRGERVKLLDTLLRKVTLPDYAPGQYHHRFAQTVAMTFILPKHATKGWEKVWTSVHRQTTLLLAALVQEMETGQDYLDLIHREVDVARKRNDNDTVDAWNRILATIGTTRTLFRDMAVRNQEAMLQLDNRQASDDDLRRQLLRMNLPQIDENNPLTQEELADKHIEVKHLTYAFRNEAVIQRLQALITRKTLGTSSRTQLLHQLKDIFAEVHDQLQADNALLYEEAQATFGRVTKFGGPDTATIAKILREKYPLSDVTRDEAEQAIHAFYARHGRIPTTRDKDAPKYLGTGFNTTWPRIDKGLKRDENTSLQALGERLYPPAHRPKSDQQLRFEKSVRARPGIFEALAVDCIAQMKAHPGVMVSIRAIDEMRRARGETFTADAGAGSNFYATTLITLVPAFKAVLKTGSTASWTIDWPAIDIDPTDTKWDDFHAQAGGTLPRFAKAVFNIVSDGQWRSLGQLADHQKSGASDTPNQTRRAITPEKVAHTIDILDNL